MSQRNLFLNNLAQTSDFPLMLEIEKAEGAWLFGKNGEKYLDLISGIGVSNVGHRHPKIVEAIHNQIDKYLHLMVYGEYIQSPQVLLAETLVKTLAEIPTEKPKIDNVYLTNSGTEAVEGAMKLAKRYTGRREFISCKNAYHGATQGALSLSGSEHFKQNFRPLLPEIKQINFGEIADLEHITVKTAAIIIETVQGESGVNTATAAYWKALEIKCLETGTLLILDEIQCGFGRTGSFWAFEQYGIYPDILLSAKGMGGGMPIGAFMANESIMSVFKNNPILGHITTFGGHPVSAAASLATLNVIFEENLLKNVKEKAERIKNKLIHPKIKVIRNQGLMMAAEFESFEILKPIIDKAISNGVITDWFLFCDNSMRIAPPLTITIEEIDWACDIILNAIN
ncbi:MAG: aspartate aminotransferase family protein [Bacteroidota bacterium]